MQSPRFVVLTGHLNDYPLSDLVGILRYQRKTGRLLIEYPNGPAAFYFQDGELIDVQVDKLTGLQAICIALAQPPSPFNFNPLIAPARRSIDNSLQRVVSELLGCWEESPVQIEAPVPEKTLTTVYEKTLVRPEPLAIPESTAPETQVQALDILPLATTIAATNSYSTRVVVLTLAAVALTLLGLPTVIALTGGFKGRAESPKLKSPPVQASARLDVEKNEGVPAISIQVDPSRSVEEEVTDTQRRLEPYRFKVHTKARASIGDPSGQTPSSSLMANDARETNSAEQVSNANTSVQSVDVVMQIENGRVLRASIANPRRGMDGYEALALRIARQRRYPGKKSGQETVRIRVSPPD